MRPKLALWQGVVAAMLAGDLLAIAGGLLMAHHVRYSSAAPPRILSEHPDVPTGFLLVLGVLWLLSLVTFRLYQRDYCVAGMEEYRRVVVASFTSGVGAIAVAYATVLPLSRAFLVLSFTLVTLGLCLNRFCARRFTYSLARRGRRIDRILIVGASKQGLATAVRLQDSPSASAEVCGFLDEYRAVGQRIGDRFPVLGEPLDLWQVARDKRITKAILIQSAMSWESLHALIPRMHRRTGMEILLAAGMLDLNVTQLDMRQLGPILLAAPRAERIDGVAALVKRALDLAIAPAVLVLTAPITVGVCCWLALKKGRWPIVRKPVIGRGGRCFMLHEIAGSNWLRRTHLSRLPSLFAVITGKMSIVGPRPMLSERLLAYNEWAELLMSVRPGFIGPWWEGLPRHTEEEIQLDVRYLQNYSALADLQILWHSLLGLRHRAPGSTTPTRPAASLRKPAVEEPVHG